MKLSPREIELQEARLRRMAYMNSPERLANLAKAGAPAPHSIVDAAPPPEIPPARKKPTKKAKIGRKRGKGSKA